MGHMPLVLVGLEGLPLAVAIELLLLNLKFLLHVWEAHDWS
jgi:hypothetical protein